MDVFHVVLPAVTETGIEPHPLLGVPKFFLISSDSFFDTLTKCHAAFSTGYSHTSDRILYFFFFMQKKLAAGFHKESLSCTAGMKFLPLTASLTFCFANRFSEKSFAA